MHNTQPFPRAAFSSKFSIFHLYGLFLAFLSFPLFSLHEMLFSALFPVSLLHFSGHWHCFIPVPKTTQNQSMTPNITAKPVLRDATQRTTTSLTVPKEPHLSGNLFIYSGLRAYYSSLEQNTPISFPCWDLGILHGGRERRRTQYLMAQGTRSRIFICRALLQTQATGNGIYHRAAPRWPM